MKEIPIGVPVECSDGKVGESTSLIVHPTKLTVTHIVVEDTSFPSVERLVPVEQILDATPDSIQLACTKHELANMEGFVERHYIKREQEDTAFVYMHPYATPVESGYVRIDEHRVPPGELEVRRGTRVEATDGDIGVVGELLIDPDSDEITHLILMEGHAWGDTEISLPLSAIDHVSGDVVYLKLDKNAIHALPAIPVKRAGKGVHASDMELLVLVFDQVDAAEEALKAIKHLSQEWDFLTLNSAVVVKDQKGKSHLKESADVDAKHGALFGAITGGLIGLTRGPAGVIVGAVAGATTGGVTAHLSDMGFHDEDLQVLSESLESGSSALVVMFEHKWVDETLNYISDLGAEIWMKKISDDLVARFLNEED